MITWIRTPTFSAPSENDDDEDVLSGTEPGDARRGSLQSGTAQFSRIQRLRRHLVDPYLQKRAKYGSLQPSLTGTEFELVHFSAGGRRFASPDTILANHPNTVLGDPAKRSFHYSLSRHTHTFSTVLPDVFEAVLEFYEGAPLIRPDRLTVDYFLEQLEIFEFDASVITRYLRSEGVKLPRKPPTRRTDIQPAWKDRIWDFFVYPELSLASRAYNVISLIFTCVSIAIYALETVPELNALMGTTQTLGDAFKNPFFIINTICYIFFTVELVGRFVGCPDKLWFFRRWYHWVDLVSILAHVIVMVVMGTGGYSAGQPNVARQIGVIRAIRLFRILKPIGASKTIGSPSQYWIGILWQTVRNNASTLLVLLFLLLLCMVLFAGIQYAIEGGPGQAIPSIPHGFWWAIITMTTVGYGDIYPRYAAGQFVAVICGSVGLIFIAFLLHSVSSGYQRLMKNNAEYRRYLMRQKKRRLSQQPREDSLFASTSSTLDEEKASQMGEQIVVVNGAEFIIPVNELALFPDTLISNHEKRTSHFLKDNKTLYFPRSASIFPSFASFYKSGGFLRRPPFVPMRKFVEELVFYEMGEKALTDLFASEGISLERELEPTNRLQLFWYRVWEHPEFNCISRTIAIISILIITTSVTTLILETIPQVLSDECIGAHNNASATNSSVPLSKKLLNQSECAEEWTFFILESVCTSWYTLELVSRFIVAPSKIRFAKAIMNWVDALTIFPYIFTLIEMFSDTSPSSIIVNSFGFLRTIRLIRLIALFKFSRFSKTMQMILTILRSAWFELCMSCYFSFVMAIIFGTTGYLFEQMSDKPNINSIPRGMYWAWITMLTIGYGDIVPVTVGGYIIGGLCAIAGTLFWSLPMTLVADHYAKYRGLYNDQEFMIAVLERLERARKKREGSLVHSEGIQPLDLRKIEALTEMPETMSGFVSLPPSKADDERTSEPRISVMGDSVATLRPVPRNRSLEMIITSPPIPVFSEYPIPSKSHLRPVE
ncbi:uncharacterized protein LOC129590082 [Paramacrobiotus metropolitanus]|uniref:uncharacterized protein LOC129590082 n=1 Tax=Paramacrobiotus metropolitanus TaxID=2943436 RepID=UPI00244613BC|nr:uncharacterized protein LOC129590082 [Paramacrobiotus metropolitanus]